MIFACFDTADTTQGMTTETGDLLAELDSEVQVDNAPYIGATSFEELAKEHGLFVKQETHSNNTTKIMASHGVMTMLMMMLTAVEQIEGAA